MYSEASNPNRLFEFDFLRALAVLVLLFHHGGIYNFTLFGAPLSLLQPFGTLVINGSFLFISGYFTLISFQNRKGSLIKFFWSKFVRIYPPYFVALILFVYILGFTLRKRDFFVYLIGLQTIFSPAIVKPMLTLWFIGVLGLYLVIFGLAMRSFRQDVYRLIAALTLFIFTYWIRIATGLIDDRFFLYYFVFLMGAVIARYPALTEIILSMRWIWGKFIFTLLGSLFYGLVIILEIDVLSFLYLASAGFFILSLDILLLSIFSRVRLQTYPLVRNIAKTSFFAYLFHRPIWKILNTMLGVETGFSETMLNLIPGSILVIFLSFYLQNGYDRLVSRK